MNLPPAGSSLAVGSKSGSQGFFFSTSKETWTRLPGLIGDTFITRSACLEMMNPWALGWKAVTSNYK